VQAATLQFRLPTAWRAGTSWREAPGAPGHAIVVDQGRYLPGMFAIGRVAAEAAHAGSVEIQYALAGPKMSSQAALVESAVAQAFSYFIRLMGDLPHVGPNGQRLEKVFIVVADESRRDFIGGGLAGRSVSILESPTATATEIRAMIAHELFHFWNGRAFVNASPREGWFAEGFTEYYAWKALHTIGAISDAEWRANLAAADARYRSDSGYTHISIADAGALKFRHQGLVYAGGEVAAACIDEDLRRRANGRTTLDQIMQAVFQRFNASDPRYDNGALASLIETESGLSYRDWFREYIDGARALPQHACGEA